jgi:hypothetical protein
MFPLAADSARRETNWMVEDCAQVSALIDSFVVSLEYIGVLA